MGTCAQGGPRSGVALWELGITEVPEEVEKAMTIGTVKFFNDQKGYGFISRDDGEDLFVHFSNIIGSGRRTLVQGQKVTFEIGEGRRGPEARSVQPV